MISYICTLLILLIITFTAYVDSECVHGQITAQITKYGTVDTQCTFKNIKVLSGSSFKLPFPDCLECKCTTKTMACCGFGFTAGKVVPPLGCVAHNDACKLVFVKENNPSEICKSGKSTTTTKKKSTTSRRS